ncbi:MAG: DUF3180 family protein [Pseudolysinimonas sp.]
MTRTRATTLIVLAVIGTVAGILLQSVLAALSMPKLRPEYTLAITLVLIGVAAVALAVPVRRATRGNPAHRVDPFYATNVVVLAKASALAGALLAGFGLGLVLELIFRSGAPGTDFYLRVFSVLGAGTVLMVGGLIAEYLCTVPKRSDDDPDVGPTATAG